MSRSDIVVGSVIANYTSNSLYFLRIEQDNGSGSYSIVCHEILRMSGKPWTQLELTSEGLAEAADPVAELLCSIGISVDSSRLWAFDGWDFEGAVNLFLRYRERLSDSR